MLADTLTLVGGALIALVGTALILMIVMHAYAWWTIKGLDQD
jgi:hypothetical protein